VANRGDGPAGDVRVRAEHPEPDVAELIEGSASFTSIAPGETVTAKLRVKRLKSGNELPPLVLDILETDHRLFVSSKVDLQLESQGWQRWMDPPRVHFARVLVPTDGSDQTIVAEITDDSGIARTWAVVDGDKVSYADTSSVHPTTHAVPLPWDPHAEARRYEIVVRDVDGLVTRLVTRL